LGWEAHIRVWARVCAWSQLGFCPLFTGSCVFFPGPAFTGTFRATPELRNTQDAIKNTDFERAERNLIAASVVGFIKSSLNSPAWSSLELQRWAAEIYILIEAEDKIGHGTAFARYEKE